MLKEAKMEEHRKVIAELKAHAIKDAKPEDSIFFLLPSNRYSQKYGKERLNHKLTAIAIISAG